MAVILEKIVDVQPGLNILQNVLKRSNISTRERFKTFFNRRNFVSKLSAEA